MGCDLINLTRRVTLRKITDVTLLPPVLDKVSVRVVLLSKISVRSRGVVPLNDSMGRIILFVSRMEVTRKL